MMGKTPFQKISFIYLSIVPVLATALAFIIGGVSCGIYLPVWLIHSGLMIFIASLLGGHALAVSDHQNRQLYTIGMFMVLPWVLVTIFAGMGPPPPTAAEWGAKATEQQARYVILIISGLVLVVGSVFLRQWLKNAGENFYSLIGVSLIMIAAPLFLMNMIYWGSFLTYIFSSAPSPANKLLLKAIQQQFLWVRSIEVGLIYLSTVAFALALKITGWFKPGASYIYVASGVLGFVLNLLPATSPEPLATLNYLSYIPAFTILMPYYMGINLLKQAGHQNKPA